MTELRFKIEKTLLNEDLFKNFLEKYNNGLGWYVEDYYLIENYGKERLRKRFDGTSTTYQLVVGKTGNKKVSNVSRDNFETLKSKNEVYLIKKDIVNVIDLANYTMCVEHIKANGKEYITAEIELSDEYRDRIKAEAEALNFFRVNHLDNVKVTTAPLYGFIKPKKRRVK